MIQINGSISIPEEELEFTASRSSGPGGQNVNKVSTRVTLRFDVVNATSLSSAQKKRIQRYLASRISKDGILQVVSQRHRSQSANRRAAVERFVDLIRQALKRVPPRKRTQVPHAVKKRRLEEKRIRGQLKRRRSQRVFWDETG